MLVELKIKDFAIIDSLSLEFGPGLNVFTGETGAGKSILVDAVALILGDRASNEIIRTSSDEAQVEALFDVTGCGGIDEVLSEAGIESTGELVVKRVIQKAGRNKIYINGSLATLVTLTEVGGKLIDIYGQSSHQSLSRPEEHVEMLDVFGGLGELREEMASRHRELASVTRELERITEGAGDAEKRTDFLSYQIREIDEAGLKPGEEEELKKISERLKNSEKIKAAATEVERIIYSEEGSVIERLGASIKALKDASVYDETLKKTVEILESSFYQLEDASMFLRGYAEGVEASPEELEKVLARLDLITRLKKKYGPTAEDVLAKRDELSRELKAIEDSDEAIKELQKKAASARERAELTANKLTEERTRAAGGLKKKIEAELEGLGMEGAVFEVFIEPDAYPDGARRLGEKGGDRVRFFLSPNPGEEIKPLAKIASGGELSRIMLAIKKASTAGRVPSVIFDEIDTGVGGKVAHAVGLKMKEVSRDHQVLCITHLPQIAAFADRHYSVAKGATGEGRTVASVRSLDDEQSVDEISRMLGGVNITETTRKHARELVSAARASRPPAGRGAT